MAQVGDVEKVSSGLRKFTDGAVEAQEDLREERRLPARNACFVVGKGREKGWIKNGVGLNPGLRKFTDVALWRRWDLRKAASPLTTTNHEREGQ